MTLRLLSYNIRFGGHGREQALAETISAAAPDLVVFQEATDPAVIQRISDATKFPFWAARRNHSIGFLSREEVFRAQGFECVDRPSPQRSIMRLDLHRTES